MNYEEKQINKVRLSSNDWIGEKQINSQGRIVIVRILHYSKTWHMIMKTNQIVIQIDEDIIKWHEKFA